jgi:hypothetical protein
VEQTATGNRFETRSNQTGFFVFPPLQPGGYGISVVAPGMNKWEGTVQLQTGQNAVVDAVLTVGAAATQITVAGDITPLVTTTAPTLSTVVERQRIEQLPLNGRFLNSLIMVTTPGLEGGGNRPYVFGLRDGSMEFLQDGASLNDANVGMIATRPPGLDTIQEYRVETSVASAKNARPSTTVLSTRSGGNEWHGSLFYTGRNNGFGVARRREDYYDNAPPLIRNEYGASIGGPVHLPKIYNGRNRTFFFFAWEGLKLREQGTLESAVPTMAMREGDFSGLRDAQGRLLTLYDPWSTQSEAQKWARTPFPNNTIPMRLRSPLATYIYSVTPAPTMLDVNPVVASNYFGPEPTRQDDSTYTLRLDHRLTDSDQIYGRYSFGNRNIMKRRAWQNNTPMTADRFWNYEETPEQMQSAMFSWNHIFSPSLFVETIATGSRIFWRYSTDAPATTQNVLVHLGLPNPFGLNGAPTLNDLGWSLGYVGSVPRSQDNKPWSVEQNYTWVKNAHQFEFGGRFRRAPLDVLPDQPAASTIRFNSMATALYDPATAQTPGAMARTGYDGANFFLGVASQYSQTVPPGWFNIRGNETAFYFQDNWKATRDLTINLGLRYEYLPPMLDANGVNAVFDEKTKTIVRKASITELIQAGYTTQAVVDAYTRLGVKFATPGEAGLPDSLVRVGQKNFSPRLGFAYTHRLASKTFVLRGGYGEYRFALPARTFNDQRMNAPLQGTFSYNISGAATSPDGRANWGLRSAPTVIAGTSSKDAIDPNSPSAIARGIGINTFAPDLPQAMAREWSFTVETELMKNTVVRLGYVGTAGRNLEATEVLNGQLGAYAWYVSTGEPLPTGAYAPVIRRSIDQTTYGAINRYRKSGYSNFNGFQAEMQRRFSHGLGFQFFYVMSNALSTGSYGELARVTIPDTASFLPGTVPQDFDERNRFLNYQRDNNIAKHRVRWNVLYDLPFGNGRQFLSKSNGLIDRIVGGWQIAAYAQHRSRYWTLPTANWGSLGQVEVYGTKYPIEDCRSGRCIPGYLYYNGYLPANRINSTDAQGRPNGVMGVPSNYKPAHQPIYPTPADGGSPSDPNYSQYETNNAFVTLKNGTQQRVAYEPGPHPWQNQYVAGPWAWDMNGSLFKTIPIDERFRLRLNMDFFNLLNMPGVTMPNSSTGILSLQSSNNAPRQLQWTLRLTW